MIFPPLRDAGMAGPIMVMLREHAQMWPILGTLDQCLADDVGDEALHRASHQLLALLQDHNPKEEQLLYPRVDVVVGEHASIDARELLAAGQVPEGWACQGLFGAFGRRSDTP